MYNGNNQVSGASYDNAGNTLLANGDTLVYDAESRQRSATEPPGLGGGTEYYVYDGVGQRVEKATNPTPATIFVYDAFGLLAAEYNAGAAGTPACTTCYLSADYLGSLRLVTDENGTVIGRHDYLPFGEEIPANTAGRNAQFGSANDSVAQKFTGQFRDAETGIDYFQARYFSAPQWRFNSPDPLNAGADLTNPQSWNAYGYVLGNPRNGVDPSGMNCVTLDNGATGDDGQGTPCAGSQAPDQIDVNGGSTHWNMGVVVERRLAVPQRRIGHGKRRS